ncbi:MAG: hypothetical protein LBM96_05935 [Methanobrevibacter sp.]|jgi:hypothetical protein|nr:hypothetical protein [Candidatus Methanoflexus mossambicus]
MNNLILDKKCLENEQLSIEEACAIIIISKNIDYNKILFDLKKKKYIDYNTDEETGEIITKLTALGIDKYNSAIVNAEMQEYQDSIDILAKQMKELFPKGIKEGTSNAWTDAVPLIVKRLKMFFKKYDILDLYNNEDILNATKRYVEFNKNNQYMQTLRYFIMKDNIELNQSELLNYLEDTTLGSENNEIDWTKTIEFDL